MVVFSSIFGQFSSCCCGRVIHFEKCMCYLLQLRFNKFQTKKQGFLGSLVRLCIFLTVVVQKSWIVPSKDVMQGKLFQRFTHFLYCSVLSLGGKVNTRRMSQPDMESIFTKIIYEIFLS